MYSSQKNRQRNILGLICLGAGAAGLAWLLAPQNPMATPVATRLTRPDPAGPLLQSPAAPVPQRHLPNLPPGLRTETVGQGEAALEVASGEVMVHAQEGVSFAEMQLIAEGLHSEVLQWGERSNLYRLRVPEGMSMSRFQRVLTTTAGINDARPNAITRATGSKTTTPTSMTTSTTTTTTTTAVTSCPNGEYLNREWTIGRLQWSDACASYNSALKEVVVAVLDTGIAYEGYETKSGTLYAQHTDFKNVNFVPGWDFVNNDAHPNDDHQHGTHIAGIIGSQGKIVGVAPGVKLMPVKVLGSDETGTEMQLVEGIYYAVDHGADILNMSLSFGRGFYPSASLQAAIDYAVASGVVMVASVGNSNYWGVTYPGAFQDVIAVGATRFTISEDGVWNDKRATYSDVGYRLDLMAPAGMVDSDLDLNGRPDGTLAPAFTLNQPTALTYVYYSGSSQAAAHVSGMAAWLLADGASPAQVRTILQTSAKSISSAGNNYDYQVGAGLAQLDAARDLVHAGPLPATPQYYVNIIPSLHSLMGGVYANMRVEVVDGAGIPVTNVKVAGSWYGSRLSYSSVVPTNAQGVANVTSFPVWSSTGVVFGFVVDRLLLEGKRVVTAPKSYYSLSPASAELYSRLMADATYSQAVVLFKVDASNPGMSTLVDTSNMVKGFALKPLGAGFATGPAAVIMDESFAPEVTNAPSGAVTQRTWTFPAALYSGWGLVSQMSGTQVDAASSRLGAAGRYLILPLDPAMGKMDLQHCYPVLNASSYHFQEENIAFGNGFAASSLGSGFAASAMGSGFASSSLGDGFAASSLGSGFAASSLGSGFAASALGSGFAASSMGSGFVASSLGSGFAVSSMGSGNESIAMGMGCDDESLDPVDEGKEDPKSLITDPEMVEEPTPHPL